MDGPGEHLDQSISEVDRLRKNLKRSTSKQVKSREEKNISKSTALAWFNGHLNHIRRVVGDEDCQSINWYYHELLSYADKDTTRLKYDSCLKELRKCLSSLRKTVVDAGIPSLNPSSSDTPPEFSTLIGDVKMQGILSERWKECVICIDGGAYLSATVMMGGLLETMLLARFNQEPNKERVFSSSQAPIDKKTGKAMPLNSWTLKNYLNVAHELKWISRSTKDVGEVLRDYRNYVHPYKQASHGVRLDNNDARIFWELTKEIARQLL
ncbi:hypothetical protein LL252_18960 [Alcanivorax marinus]|uniref:Uncharacterized protein n=1 Tax=Alloalcanivorax marinus TaxID=1177169 RepID=A0A9Q3UPA4_9GAMM|nr:hypothetical protein [Alloalcanivorax marinus]MCC4310647.1 hypothetical protein [Alloalcanivorax marinus]